VEGNLSKYLRDKTDAIVEATRITQTMVANEARHLVPVDTGALQRSIQEGRVELKGETVRGFVYALQEYASFVEEGTSRQRAQPYLRPAMEKHVDDFIRLLKRVMRP
jgi:HK97 gp10 family phage protein